MVGGESLVRYPNGRSIWQEISRLEQTMTQEQEVVAFSWLALGL